MGGFSVSATMQYKAFNSKKNDHCQNDEMVYYSFIEWYSAAHSGYLHERIREMS